MVNNIKALLLLVVMGSIALGIGALFGLTGLIIGGVIGVVMAFSSYWWSDKMVLRMAGAKEVSEAEEPRLHQMVTELADKAGIPKPKVFIVHNDAPNAFATGRSPKHGVIAATTGIMRVLSEEELRGVLGHELGHIRNRDMLVSAIAAAMAIAIMMAARLLFWASLFGRRSGGYGAMVGIGAMLIGMIVAPLAASLVRAAISRSRESGADEAGARITGTPLALASALEKIENYSRARPMQVNQAVAPLFIINPLKGGDFVSGLFRTHPPTEHRVRRLRELAKKMEPRLIRY